MRGEMDITHVGPFGFCMFFGRFCSQILKLMPWKQTRYTLNLRPAERQSREDDTSLDSRAQLVVICTIAVAGRSRLRARWIDGIAIGGQLYGFVGLFRMRPLQLRVY